MTSMLFLRVFILLVFTLGCASYLIADMSSTTAPFDFFYFSTHKAMCRFSSPLTWQLTVWFMSVFAEAMLALDAFLFGSYSGFILQTAAMSQMLGAVTRVVPRLQTRRSPSEFKKRLDCALSHEV